MNDDEIVFVEKLDRIEIYKECPKCGKQNEITATLCCTEGCNTDLTRYPIRFQMKIFLIIPLVQKCARNIIFLFNGEPTPCYQERSFVTGSKLWPILGMTCNDFIELSNNHGFDTMTYLLSKFFYKSYFLMNRGYDRLLRINLLKESKLHFLNWLSMQSEYGFSYDIIISEIINRYYHSSDDESETKEEPEDMVYYIKFTQKFFEKNTKFFGKSPNHIETNIYDIISSTESEDPVSSDIDHSLSFLSGLPECEVFG